MSALGRVVRAGVGRRRVQTLAMLLTTTTAVTASVLAAGLLVASEGPFDQAFARQNGAQLTAQFDGAKATAAQVAATVHVSGVTEAAGPYPVLSIVPHVGRNGSGMPMADALAPMTIVGRAGAGGPVDDLRLTSGTWATRPGQIVLEDVNAPLAVGDHITFPGVPGRPTLTVVGLAASVGDSADAWVSPAQLAALTTPGTVPTSQMLYRFASAGTDAQVSADRARIAAAVPPGSMIGAASYLKLKLAADKSSATYVPFVTAFSLLGLAMSMLIIGIVVGGAVTTGTRRIGILKALGFTPAQVTGAYVAQGLLPATAGTVLGVVLGNLLAIPIMDTAGSAFGTGTETIAPWIDVAVAAVALAAVTTTALAPALRAGRLRTVEALAVAGTPRSAQGGSVRQFAGKLPLPRSVTLGLAHPFARPARSATMIAAVVLGAAGVSFGVGLGISLGRVQNGLDRQNAGSVIVQPFGPPAPPVPGMRQVTAHPDAETIAAKISAQPGTSSYFSTGQTQVSVAGLAGATEVIAYQGDSSWGAYQIVSGSWFSGPGEVVAPAAFLSATGTHVGSTITLTTAGRSARVRIVGEVFTLHQVILTDRSSLRGLGSYIIPQSVQFNIALKPGVSQQRYITSLDAALAPYGVTAQSSTAGLSSTVIAMDTLAAVLTLMLIAVAGLGILNTVMLDARERVYDVGVLKALGMSPRQTVTMILTSVALTGLLASAIGVPIGIALHDYVLPAMGNAAGTTIPAVDTAAYSLPVLIALILGGLIIATAGALPPASWAARTRTATALRTE